MSYYKTEHTKQYYKTVHTDRYHKTVHTDRHYKTIEGLVPDVDAPVFVSAVIPADGMTVTLTYTDASGLKTTIVPATTDYALTGTSSTVSSVQVNALTVVLTLDQSVYQGETVTLNYTPGTNKLQDNAGNLAAALSGESVTNNSTQTGTPAVLNDGNTVAWFDYEENVTKDGSNYVSIWGDKSGNNNDLEQLTGANQPIYSASGILFDGVSDNMKTDPFTLNQPEFIYIVLKQVSYTGFDCLFDGNSNLTGALVQPALNALRIQAGASLGNVAFTVGDWGIVRVVFNGASSKIQVNEDAALEGNPGANNMGGFTIGSRGGLIRHGNVEVKEIIIRKIVDATGDEQDIYDYLANKYGL
jgi:hypothetical protein